MLGIVIVAHGGLAFEYLSAAEHVVGINTNVKAISIYPSDNMCEKEIEIVTAISDIFLSKQVISLLLLAC